MSARRKLAAILSADVAGYSRLMAADEAGTLHDLNQARAVFSAAVQAHHGRVVDTAGDSVLAEFDSPVEAVRCAAKVQQELGRRGTDVPSERRMLFRIGVNLGDVIEENAGLYGDGVNVAARLQALSEPGGLSISGTVFDQVDGKLPLAFKFMGEQAVKNIPKPVRVYRLIEGGPGQPGDARFISL
jgi:adenylate cyclase